MTDLATHPDPSLLADPGRRCRCPQCGGTVVRQFLARQNRMPRKRVDCAYCHWHVYLIYKGQWQIASKGKAKGSPSGRVKVAFRRGMTAAHYNRWIRSGKPDLEAFKAAGCPMPQDWEKLQERISDDHGT